MRGDMMGSRNDMMGSRSEMANSRNDMMGSRNKRMNSRNEVIGSRKEMRDMTGGQRNNDMRDMMGSRGDMMASRNDMRDVMGRDNFRDLLGGSRDSMMQQRSMSMSDSNSIPIVSSAPPPLYPAPSLSDPPALQHSPELSLEDRKRELKLFETVNIRSENQLIEFQELFESGNYNINNALFQSWLPLKRGCQEICFLLSKGRPLGV